MDIQQKNEIKGALIDSLKEVFGDSDSKNPEQMTILVRRIPILCTQIDAMRKQLDTLHENNGKWDSFLKDDANWKREFDMWKTKIVEPLIKKEMDEEAVKDWQLNTIKIVGSGAAGLVAIWLAIHYWGFLIGIHI